MSPSKLDVRLDEALELLREAIEDEDFQPAFDQQNFMCGPALLGTLTRAFDALTVVTAQRDSLRESVVIVGNQPTSILPRSALFSAGRPIENQNLPADAVLFVGVEGSVVAVTNIGEADEGGEDVFGLPEFCVKWPCCVDKKPLVENERGFMVCPLCGDSYGRSE